MSKEISVFRFESHDVRTFVDSDGEPWFVAKDVALALGYVDTSDAVRNHCKKAKSLKELVFLARGGSAPPLDSQVKLIPESDVYRLTMRSTLPSAVKFQDWVCEEVLPSIRRIGHYSLQSDNQWQQIRDRGKRERKQFTSVLSEHGVKGRRGFSTCTDEVNKCLFGATAKQLKREIAGSRGISDPKRISAIKFRDEIDGAALAMILVTEQGSANRIDAQNAQGSLQCRAVINDVATKLVGLIGVSPNEPLRLK